MVKIVMGLMQVVWDNVDGFVWVLDLVEETTCSIGIDLEAMRLFYEDGKTRIAIARQWVQDMAAFAEENGLESQLKLEIIPGKGYSMGGLILYSQGALVSP